MLFNSYEFIFLFLPATLLVFFLLGTRSRYVALNWIIIASLGFYAWWRPLNLLIIPPAIFVNFCLARAMAKLGQEEKRGASKAVLIVGIAFNVLFLGYFKYANFGAEVVNDVFGRDLVLARIILPLGISFVTFQQITFLIDVHGRRVEAFTLRNFFLFVLFFPQLIAGPIVHYREMMPQFLHAPCVFDRENVSVGITLFVFGLFKKVYLADGVAPYVSPIYQHAMLGEPISLLPAWMAAIGFTFQIYFDFSGYTDMALGIARCFGIRLPRNFYSPLRTSNIIDFWLCWHITLTRFLTAYLFNPIALSLTRRRLARGRAVYGGRNTTFGAFLALLMFPTMVTMFLSGLWHGAGYTFVLWGLLHGFYLTVNHGWRLLVPKLWTDRASYTRVMQPVGFVLTFVCVAFSMILFRSPTIAAAGNLLKGMIGLNGLALPGAIYAHLGPLADWLREAGVLEGLGSAVDTGMMAIWIPALAIIAFTLPNTLQILDRHEPAIGIRPDPDASGAVRRAITWSASPAWALLLSLFAAVAILHLGGQSEFLYWQF